MRKHCLFNGGVALIVGVAISLTGCSYAKEENNEYTKDNSTEITQEKTEFEENTDIASAESNQQEAEAATEQRPEDATGQRPEALTEQSPEDENTEVKDTEDDKLMVVKTPANSKQQDENAATEQKPEDATEHEAEYKNTEVNDTELNNTKDEELTVNTEEETQNEPDTTTTEKEDANTFYDYVMAEQIVSLVNQEREMAGVAPLTMNYSLCKASDIRAKEIGVSFSHTRPDGSSCITAISQAGVSFGYAGENIAAGYYSAESVMKAWINSEGHYANIISPYYTQIAVSCYYDPETYGGYNWAQLFISD